MKAATGTIHTLHESMQRLRQIGWLACLAVLACGCAQLREREFVIPAARLTEALAKRVGTERKLLDVLTVTIERPELKLDPATQRLRADFHLVLRHPFSSRPVTGRAGISGALGFDHDSASVMLLEPKVETLELDSVPPALSNVLARLGAALGAELLAKYPLVSLRDKDLQNELERYGLVRFEVLEDAVRVTLQPKQ